MPEERRVDMTDLVFKIGEIHARAERIPIIEKNQSEMEARISKCSNKSKMIHATSAFGGGILGGFIAMLAKFKIG